MRFTYLIIMLALFALGCDSDEPQAIPPPSDPQILITHNKWRAVVGVADLEWSENLAKKAFALLDGNACEIKNNTEGLGQLGSFAFMGFDAEDVVDSWASSIQNYNYDLDSCTATAGNCDSYKQIVWANTTMLGCASITCLLNNSTNPPTMWVCLYDPPGNIPGEKPY